MQKSQKLIKKKYCAVIYSLCSFFQVCYSEYYTVRWTTGEIDHIFDRFCAHYVECTFRGFYPNCLSLPDLDEKVRQTFFAQQAKTYQKRIDQILHSRFEFNSFFPIISCCHR
ncbi:unnamed protein product [Enterobius vermicularis]|uniref:DUF7773 domain-containing protein n=1 Tax=Enterobius vermicularis TaxID=51028 RepID=A0A0N4VAQ3_ENTVE|nr:unnamed protein product [Enterobius vermicularis]